MEKVTISKGQIWTKKSPTGKRGNRNYEVKEVFADDEVDTIVVLRDFNSNNPIAKEAHDMLNDESWVYRSSACVVEEVIVKKTIDFGEDVYPSTKPKKKKKKKEVEKVFIPFPVKEEATATGVDVKREAQRQCAETQSKGKKPTQIAKALANAKVKPAEKKVVPIVADEKTEVKEIRDWNTFNHYRYDSFDIFANILRDTETISLHTIRTGFRRGIYKPLHSQAIAMWRDGEMSLNEIRLVQPTPIKNQLTGEIEWRPCRMHNFVIRMIKAVYHFGILEEKKALFEEFN
jgi:hypothetical protein